MTVEASCVLSGTATKLPTAAQPAEGGHELLHAYTQPAKQLRRPEQPGLGVVALSGHATLARPLWRACTACIS